MPRPYFGDHTPIAFAHRGGANHRPENTLLAFQNAIDLGYRYIETDIHLTADGHLVIFHDDTVDRTTNGTGRVRDFTFAELQALDAGYAFAADKGYPYRGRGAKVPALIDALALHPDLRLNLEIKPHDLRVVNALWELIERERLHDRVLVASANTEMVRAFRRLCRHKVATSASEQEIFRFWLQARAGFARFASIDFDALQVPPTHQSLTVITKRFVEMAHHHGVQVHAWTIDEPEEMRRLLELGVDAIMSDEPETLLRVLNGAA